MNSRERILAGVRQALAAGRPGLPVARPAPLTPPPAAWDSAEMVRRFQFELEKLGALFIAERPDRAARRVAELLRERNLEAVLAWREAHLPAPGILDVLRREGVRIVGSEVQPDEPARSQRLAELEPVVAGLTGVDAALAETGTLALRSGPGRPRLASLSVRTHLALVTPGQLYPSWAAWWAARPDRAEWVAAASNLTLISGPSRTADIEMTLTVGVHGPAEVIVLYLGG